MLFVIEVDNDGFKVYDSAGNLIDPAKDSSVQSVLTALTAIKDTDGIKKIVDALPAGSNTLGKIDQGAAGATAWKTDGSGVTQPVSAASLPLPAGAATESTLLSIKGKTDSIPADPAREGGNLATLAGKDFATQTTLASIDTKTPALVSGRQPVDGSGVTQPISAASLPLPAGAATEATLAAIKDTAGVKKITDALPAGDNAIGRIKITDGTNVVDVLDSGGVKRLRVDAQVTPAAADFTFPTFVATAQNVVLGNGKSLLSLVNATGSVVIARLREIWISNSQTSAVTGVAGLFEGRRITGHSGGSSVIPLSHDTADSLNGSITARAEATVSGEAASGLFSRRISTDEWGPGTLDVEGLAQGFFTMGPIWRVVPPLKPIVLRATEGISFKCVTNTTAGAFDVTFIFTQET